jgi:hypothetical protein
MNFISNTEASFLGFDLNLLGYGSFGQTSFPEAVFMRGKWIESDG